MRQNQTGPQRAPDLKPHCKIVTVLQEHMAEATSAAQDESDRIESEQCLEDLPDEVLRMIVKPESTGGQLQPVAAAASFRPPPPILPASVQ
jgi:ABC-type dipeptide/oligopeptide/nickel transport system ATPase subunit